MLVSWRETIRVRGVTELRVPMVRARLFGVQGSPSQALVSVI
jgi:hypothetical protein